MANLPRRFTTDRSPMQDSSPPIIQPTLIPLHDGNGVINAELIGIRARPELRITAQTPSGLRDLR